MMQRLWQSIDERRHSTQLRRELAGTAIVWLAVGLAAAALRVVARHAIGGTSTFSDAFMDVWMIALWAVATPMILRSARRFAARPPHGITNALVHLALGSVFVLITNVVIRLPLLSRAGWSAMLSNTMLGIATYYPTAIISYCVIVAIGHRLFPPSDQLMPDTAKPIATVDGDVRDARLVIREWNRVHFIEPDDIEWVEADNNHVVVHTAAREYKGRERITDIEARLDARRFVRVHRSALVQVAKIREVQPLLRGDQAIVLRSGQVVRVARSRRQALEEALGVTL